MVSQEFAVLEYKQKFISTKMCLYCQILLIFASLKKFWNKRKVMHKLFFMKLFSMYVQWINNYSNSSELRFSKYWWKFIYMLIGFYLGFSISKQEVFINWGGYLLAIPLFVGRGIFRLEVHNLLVEIGRSQLK